MTPDPDAPVVRQRALPETPAVPFVERTRSTASAKPARAVKRERVIALAPPSPRVERIREIHQEARAPHVVRVPAAPPAGPTKDRYGHPITEPKRAVAEE